MVDQATPTQPPPEIQPRGITGLLSRHPFLATILSAVLGAAGITWGPGAVDQAGQMWDRDAPPIAEFSDRLEKLEAAAASLQTSANTLATAAKDLSFAPQATEVVTVTVTAADTNIRSGPGRGYDILRTVQYGRTLELAADQSDESWLMLATGGYVHTSLVE